MHGFHIAKDIIHEVNKYGKIKKALIEIGELAGITPNHLYEHLIDADFEVEATVVPALVKCTCGYKGRPKILEEFHDVVLFSCPRCDEIPEIISGDKIEVKSVEK